MLLLLLAALAAAEDITVKLSKGKLKGARLDYDHGQFYYAFKGVPYAKAPVKELRFKVGTKEIHKAVFGVNLSNQNPFFKSKDTFE